MKEKFASISQLLHEFNMQTVKEGGENAEKEEKVYNFADFSDEDIKEKFGKVATLIEEFQKDRVKQGALEKFSKISTLIEEFYEKYPQITGSMNEIQESTRESKVHPISLTNVGDAAEKVSKKELLNR